MASAVVAVLENDADVRQVLADALQFAGFAVLAPANLDASLPEPPRVTLLDTWALPPARLARLQAQWRHTPIIALVDQVADAAQVPAAAILVKPFDVNTMLALVREYTGLN